MSIALLFEHFSPQLGTRYWDFFHESAEPINKFAHLCVFYIFSEQSERWMVRPPSPF